MSKYAQVEQKSIDRYAYTDLELYEIYIRTDLSEYDAMVVVSELCDEDPCTMAQYLCDIGVVDDITVENYRDMLRYDRQEEMLQEAKETARGMPKNIYGKMRRDGSTAYRAEICQNGRRYTSKSNLNSVEEALAVLVQLKNVVRQGRYDEWRNSLGRWNDRAYYKKD